MPRYSKRHYEDIAEILGKSYADTPIFIANTVSKPTVQEIDIAQRAVWNLIERFVAELRRDNPRFDAKRFMLATRDACAFEDPTDSRDPLNVERETRARGRSAAETLKGGV